MASVKMIEENDECVIHRRHFATDGEVDEVQIEIDEILPSEITVDQGHAQLSTKTRVRIPEEAEIEEGELSSDELYEVNNRRRVLEPNRITAVENRNRRQPIQITIQNKEAAKLPDLLQEIGGHDIIGIDRDVTEKMEARAKRFNIQSAGSNIHYEDMVELYKSLGISEAEIGGQIARSERQFRLEAIHIRGFDGSITKSEDIHAYFSEFSPVSFEWVDKNSANVIWALPSSAAKALLTLSRPLIQDDTQKPKSIIVEGSQATDEDDEMVDVRKADEDAQESKEEALEDAVVEESTRIKKQRMKEKILDKFSLPHDSPVDVSEVGIEVPPYADVGKWRVGKPSDKLGVTIFMRIATRHDTSIDNSFEHGAGAASNDSSHLSSEELRQKNIKLRTSGGLISSSRKRKLQEVMLAEKVAVEEHELATKKYTGPVGKNPWGTIAEDWAGYGRTGQRDFAEELGELANLVGGKKKPLSNRLGEVVPGDGSTNEENPVTLKGETSHTQLSPMKYPVITRRAPPSFTDWDAPANEDAGTVVTSFRIDKEDSGTARKRKRSNNDHEPGEHEDHEDEMTNENEQDLKWSKRLKRPRMHMVADEIESKLSAKTRLYKGIQRRIERPDLSRSGGDRVEIFEELDDVNYTQELARRKSEPIMPDKREKLTMSIRVDNNERKKDYSGRRMSERFPAKRGISASLRDRLGDVEGKRHERDDSKEVNSNRPFGVGRHRNKAGTRHRRGAAEGYGSGDSLELDTGEDLRGELDGQHAANMMIQVTQSPKRNEGKHIQPEEEDEEGSDEEMDEDDEDDRRQESHIASVVAKIKKEKSDGEKIKIKEEPRDRDHRDRDHVRRQEERQRERDGLRRQREREKDERRREEERTRETEIQERERLRRERHRQIEERKSQQLRESRDKESSSMTDRFYKRHPRDDNRGNAEIHRGTSNERASRGLKDLPLRIKKEKLSDDERKKKRKVSPNADSSSSDDSSASSSSSSSDESTSSSSSSDSESDSGSSSSSSGSSSENEAKNKRSEGPATKKQKLTSKDQGKSKATRLEKEPHGNSKSSNKKDANRASQVTLKTKQKSGSKKTSGTSKSSGGKGKEVAGGKTGPESKDDLSNKLKDYLKKAKERRKKEKND